MNNSFLKAALLRLRQSLKVCLLCGLCSLTGAVHAITLVPLDRGFTPAGLGSTQTFTVTNTGSRGALFDTPVVFLPQVAILGTGTVQKKPVVVTHNGDDSIAIRETVYLALSYDHRIVDGADAARFLTMVKNRLEAGEFDADLGI